MIPEAREVHLPRKDRKVLEACCRSPLTIQRDLKRARIVLLAAAGRSTRSIAKEVGVQPRIVSLWRHRYADHGLQGLKDKARPNTPSADFCPAVRMPRGILSRRSDTEQISWGKFSHLPCTVAGSTLRILDGYGLRGKWPARPTLAPCIRFLSIDSHVCSTLPSDLASRR